MVWSVAAVIACLTSAEASSVHGFRSWLGTTPTRPGADLARVGPQDGGN
jgi:hypothetical protein